MDTLERAYGAQKPRGGNTLVIFYITVLRAMAACLITNAHYTGVYPTDLIANGGLIGDIIFFAVSGYCLCNVKLPFVRWYGKRVYRIYIPVAVITGIYALLGFYRISTGNWFSWFVFPTYYHFVASIILLYIPFYIVVTNRWTRKHLGVVMLFTAIVWLVVYVVAYDTSHYHIDNVHEPMIRFLFFESMLLGAYFKSCDEEMRKQFHMVDLVAVIILMAVYFASKICFSRMDAIVNLQFINQLVIFALLFEIMRLFAGLDHALNALPASIKKVIHMISEMTLEIYLVQYVIIDQMRAVFFFPVNWIVLTATILISAYVLHYVCASVYRVIDAVTRKV